MIQTVDELIQRDYQILRIIETMDPADDRIPRLHAESQNIRAELDQRGEAALAKLDGPIDLHEIVEWEDAAEADRSAR